MKIRYLDRLLSKKHDELVYSEIGLLQEGYRAFFKYKKVFRFFDFCLFQKILKDQNLSMNG